MSGASDGSHQTCFKASNCTKYQNSIKPIITLLWQSTKTVFIYIWTFWPLIGRQNYDTKYQNAIKPISSILWQSTDPFERLTGSEKTFLTVQSNKIQSYPSAHFFGKVQAPEPSQESRQSENCINYPNSINTFLTKYKCSIYISPLVSWSGQYMMCFYLRRVKSTHGPRGPDLRVLEPLAVVAVLLWPGPVVPGVLVAAGDTLQ